MWNRQILLLLLPAVVVEPRPQLLREQIPQTPLVPFNYGYEVNAEHTGDTKSQHETLGDDGVLRGSYTVVQPDGLRRVVKYTSDAENGFRAYVTFEKGYENVIPQALKNKASTLTVGSSGLSSLSQGSSLISISSNTPTSGEFTSGGSSTRGSLSTGFITGGASRGGSPSVQFTSGGSSTRGLSSKGASVGVSSSSVGGSSSIGFTTGGASRGGSSSQGFSSVGATRGVSSSVGSSLGVSSITRSSSFRFTSGGSSKVGFSSGDNAQLFSINSDRPSSASSSSVNSGSFLGLTSTGFTSSNSQISDITDSDNVQFTAHIAPSSSHSISNGSSGQDNIFTNNQDATSFGNEINVGAANFPQKGSFGDIYTNRRLSCAGCNTRSFESSKLSVDASTSAVNSVSVTGGSSSVGFTSGGSSAGGSPSVGSTSGYSSRGGSASVGITSGVFSTKGSSSIGFTSGVSTVEGSSSTGFTTTSGGSPSVVSSIVGSTSGGSNSGASSAIGFTSGASGTDGSSTLQFTSRGSTKGGLSVGLPDFSDIFSRSFLVATENLDNIDTVQLSNDRFDGEQLYAYKLVPIKIVDESTAV